MDDKGYVLFKGVIPGEVIEKLQAAITATTVDYTVINDYIQKEMTPLVNKNTGWDLPSTG